MKTESAKPYAMISVFCGVLAFALTAPFLDLRISASFSILFAIGLFLLLPWAVRREMARYTDLENVIAAPILYRGSGNFHTPAGVRNGVFFLTEEELLIFCRDKKPHLEDHLKKEDLYRIQVYNRLTARVFTRADRFFEVTAANTGRMIDAMLENRWIKGPPTRVEEPGRELLEYEPWVSE